MGGVEEGARGITITHVITYYLPTTFKGKPARIAFGLAENLATSALVGVGLLTGTNAIVSFTGQDPELYLQALQMNLPMTFEAPTLRDPPVRKDAINAYLSKQVDFKEGYYQPKVEGSFPFPPTNEDQA